MNDVYSFDYLIIGGGAAGCIVARRLAEELPHTRVALIEAGKSDENDPSATLLSRLDDQNDSYDWGYQAKTVRHLPHSLSYSRARMLGGCANHNDCAFIAPHPSDLDRWESLGARGWNSDTLADALSRVENRLYIEPSPRGNELSQAFIDGNIELGLPQREFRRSIESGTGWFPLNVRGDFRQSSSIAYLHPLEQIPENLSVFTEVSVQQLIFDEMTVIGVRTDNGIFKSQIETVLCAGAINTPQLLMLSGVGPVSHLNEIGISVVHELPGVGENLIDHVAANVCFELKSPAPPWALTPCESTSLIKVDSSSQTPDVLFHFVMRLREKYAGQKQFEGISHGVKLSPNVARPKSRGTVKLVSSDPTMAPEIDLNYLSDPEGYDRRILLGGLQFARRLTTTEALSPYLKREVLPGNDIQSDEALLDYIEQTCETVYHPCGTCAMGAENNPNAVVSPDLRVKGIHGLRIADASVFPDMVPVNICNTVMMVAERAVDVISGKEY